MVLAVPAKIIEKKEMMATVEVDGIRRNISLMLLPEANTGDLYFNACRICYSNYR